MVSVDNTAIINRILEILEDDTALAALIRDFQFGEDDNVVHDNPRPYLLVTTPDRQFTSRDQLGIGDNGTDSQTSVQYQIMGFVDGKDSEKAETEKYNISKMIVDILKANPRLKEAVGLTDPKCTRSVVFSSDNTANTRGKEEQGFVLTIICQIGEDISLVYDGTTIPVLEEVNSPHGWIISNHADDDGLVDVAPVILEERKIFKIESNATLQSTLRTKLRSPVMSAMTLTENGSARNITSALLTRVSALSVYDQVPQALIEFQIIKDTS